MSKFYANAGSESFVQYHSIANPDVWKYGWIVGVDESDPNDVRYKIEIYNDASKRIVVNGIREENIRSAGKSTDTGSDDTSAKLEDADRTISRLDKALKITKVVGIVLCLVIIAIVIRRLIVM